jgi:hypothetical protein
MPLEKVWNKSLVNLGQWLTTSTSGRPSLEGGSYHE